MGIIVAHIGIFVTRSNCVSLVIYNVANSTSVVIRIEESGERVLKLHTWGVWCFDTIWLPDCRVSEVRVNSNTVSFEFCDIVSNFESSVANVREILLVDVIRKLRLVEVHLTFVAIPLDKIMKVVFREKSIGLDIISIDLEAIFDVVLAFVNESTDIMVCSP